MNAELSVERIEQIRELRGQVKECGEWRFCFVEEWGGQPAVMAGFYCVAQFDDVGNGRFVASAPKAVDDLLSALAQSQARVAELEAENARLANEAAKQACIADAWRKRADRFEKAIEKHRDDFDPAPFPPLPHDRELWSVLSQGASQ